MPKPLKLKAVLAVKFSDEGKRVSIKAVDASEKAIEIDAPGDFLDLLMQALESATNQGHMSYDDLPAAETMFTPTHMEIDSTPSGGIRFSFTLKDEKKVVFFFPSPLADSELRDAANQIIAIIARVFGASQH